MWLRFCLRLTGRAASAPGLCRNAIDRLLGRLRRLFGAKDVPKPMAGTSKCEKQPRTSERISVDGEEENIMLQKADFDVFGSSRVMNAKGFQPRTDAQRIALKLPLDWGMDPLQDRNWRFQLQAWRMLGSAWSAGYGKDWRGLQKAIMPWVLDWHDFHVTRRLHSHFEWQDMAAGLRAQHLAMILHLQSIKKFALTPEQLAVVEELARLHISKLRDPDFISSGNHAIFQLVGLRLLGIVIKIGRAHV